MYRVKPPSKGRGFRQAFDIYELYNFADDKVARHHKAFSGQGETGSFLSVVSPAYVDRQL
jgi:hypothetical protein